MPPAVPHWPRSSCMRGSYNLAASTPFPLLVPLPLARHARRFHRPQCMSRSSPLTRGGVQARSGRDILGHVATVVVAPRCLRAREGVAKRTTAFKKRDGLRAVLCAHREPRTAFRRARIAGHLVRIVGDGSVRRRWLIRSLAPGDTALAVAGLARSFAHRCVAELTGLRHEFLRTLWVAGNAVPGIQQACQRRAGQVLIGFAPRIEPLYSPRRVSRHTDSTA